MPFSDITDTARWIALYRAQESERADALFHDPYARRLAGDPSESVQQLMKRGRGMDWSMSVRTAVIDEMILDVVRTHRVDTVLMLGAGLDTRPYRLALPPELTWHEIDLPGLVAEKGRLLEGDAAVCRVLREGMDLLNFEARAALLERVASTASRLLVVTEGLLVYFSPEQVARLATDLAIRQAFGWWITDIVSPTLLKMLVKSRGAANETGVQPTFFGPADGTAFFRPFGWRQSVYRSSIEDAVRLGRAPRSVRIALRVSRFVPGGDRLSRLSAHVLLERAT